MYISLLHLLLHNYTTCLNNKNDTEPVSAPECRTKSVPSKTIRKINEIRRRRIKSHQNDLVMVLEDGLDHWNKHDFQQETGSSLLCFKSDFFHPISASTFLGELGDYISTSCFLILKASRGICHLNINTCHFRASAGIIHADIFLGRPHLEHVFLCKCCLTAKITLVFKEIFKWHVMPIHL